MQLDRRMLDRLGRLDDEQLRRLIQQIATEAGIDPATLGIDPDNVQSIRHALQSTKEEDLARLGEVYDAYRQGRRGK